MSLPALALRIAAANVIALVFLGSYDFRIGPLHLAAHGLFKPLLYLGGAALLALLVAGARETARGAGPWPALSALLAILLYLPSIAINPTESYDWTHRTTLDLFPALTDLPKLFAWREPDGFYRPLTFVSLWLDRVIWGTRVWGYHIQNLVLHGANVLLVARLGRGLGLESGASRWAALLFGLAAINYEPVMWPGARFDLLAGSFTLLALSAALRYLEHPKGRRLLVSLLWFVLGVLSKESAYAFVPLLGLLLVWKRRVREGLPLLAGTAVCAAVLIGIRFAIFGGMAGYPDESGVAPHFTLSWKTLTSFFNRALPAPVFLINTDASPSLSGQLAAILAGAWAMLQARDVAGGFREKALLLAAALLAALPAANLVDWIGPIAHNVRYVYLTSAWIFLFTARAARNRRLLALLALANALGATHNLQTYKWIEGGPRPEATGRPETLRAAQ